MSMSTGDNVKPRMPRSKETGTLVGTRFQADLLGMVDAWIAKQPQPFPTRPEAIRRLVEAGLSIALK